MTPRVLVASHLYPSPGRPAGAPWLAEQVRVLAEAGIMVEVLCCSPFERDADVAASGPGDVAVHYRSTSAGPLDSTRAGLAIAAARYRRHLRGFLAARAGDFDLVHAHFAFPDAWATAAEAGARGLPVIVTLHGSDVTRILARQDAAGERVRSAVARAHRVICVSEALERDARAVLPESVRTTVIPNGFDDTVFSARDVERDRGYLFVGALRDVKGADALVRVYLGDARLHALPLTIAGAGPLREELGRAVAASPAAERVTFTGELGREAVADAMRRASALVVPSLREGWGAVAAEALACGTPVVGTRVGGLPQILAGPEAGILIDPGDEGALADALVRIREWPHAREVIAAASGAHPWRVEGPRIASLYREVLAESEAEAGS